MRGGEVRGVERRGEVSGGDEGRGGKRGVEGMRGEVRGC